MGAAVGAYATRSMSEAVKAYRRSHPRDLGSARDVALAAKRQAIIAAAIRAFAEHGYEGTRVEAIATELGIAKGSIFAHFDSKAGLFLAAYMSAVRSLSRWDEAPPRSATTGSSRPFATGSEAPGISCARTGTCTG